MTHTLFFSLRSPFARRIRLALAHLRIAFVPREMNVFEPPQELFEANPLGLVPVLTTPQGAHLPDSAAILEHLDETHPGAIWGEGARLRLQRRGASTWAEGIMTATVAGYLETLRKEPLAEFVQEQRETIERTLARFATEDLSGPVFQTSEGLAQPAWDLAVALEYLELRMPQIAWRQAHGSLEVLVRKARLDPDFQRTAPPA
jgi:glutathione S-transferase